MNKELIFNGNGKELIARYTSRSRGERFAVVKEKTVLWVVNLRQIPLAEFFEEGNSLLPKAYREEKGILACFFIKKDTEKKPYLLYAGKGSDNVPQKNYHIITRFALESLNEGIEIRNFEDMQIDLSD